MRKHRQDQDRGQAIVEFALVIPLIALMALALFDGGRAVIYYTELTNASRVGARVAMVNQSTSTACGGVVQTYKCAAAEIATATGIAPATIPDAVFTDSDGNTVTPIDPACKVYGACSATVSASYDFSPVTPVVNWIIGSITLDASTTMTIERIYSNP